MNSKVKMPKKGAGARLREKLREIKRNIKPSPELLEITRDKSKPAPAIEKEDDQQRRKIASPRPRGDLDL